MSSPMRRTWVKGATGISMVAASPSMVEYTEDMGAGAIEIRRPVAPGDNVLLAGEDASLGRRVLAAGVRLRPQEIGMLR